MQPFLLNCFAPLLGILLVAVLALATMRLWPNLWPPSVLRHAERYEEWLLSEVERGQLWLWPEPEAPLDSVQRRLRSSRGAFERWAAVPYNRLTMFVTSGAAVVILFAVVGLTRPDGTFWRSISAPVLVVVSAVYVWDVLYRQRVSMLEKQRVISALGSRSNAVALDAARVVVARDWHRDGSLRNSSFEYADLKGLVMARARLAGVSLMYASLEDADLIFADLASARLGSTDMRRANLNFCNLENAALSLADLGDASLGRSTLRNAHLEGANLRNTFLAEADLEGAYLEQAIYNSKTKWPEGFMPPETAVNWDALNDTERDWFRQWRWYVR